MGYAILEALKLAKMKLFNYVTAPSFFVMLPLLGSNLAPLASFFGRAYNGDEVCVILSR
jgi:hypothetical protein